MEDDFPNHHPIFQTLLDAAEKFGYSYSGDKEISEARDRLMSLLMKPDWKANVNTEYTKQVAEDAFKVWKNSVTQDTVKRSEEFQVKWAFFFKKKTISINKASF